MKLVFGSVFGAAMLLASSTVSQTAYTHALCPQNNEWLSWKTYFHINAATKTRAFLHLTQTENVPTSKTWRGRCYEIRYIFSSIDAPRHWYVVGLFANMPAEAVGSAYVTTHHDGTVDFGYTALTDDPYGGGKIGVSRSIEESGIFGDPNQYELSVRGERFVFNEAGEVYHRQYGKVGSLNCFFYTGDNHPCAA